MPIIRTRKKPPNGWDIIEPDLIALESRMREATAESHEGKRRVESTWKVFQIHHQRSRLVYNAHKNGEITKELLDFCINEKLADGNLIAKWKRSGFENLCCLRCIQARDTNFGTNCICRVPKSQLEEDRIIECIHCGCRGCSG